jgi:dolichol kinase
MPEPRAAATKEKRTSGDLSTTTVATRPTSVVPIKATEVVVTSDGEAVPEKLTRKQKKNYKKYAKKLKNRNHTNLRRKVMHACFGLGFAFLRHILPNSKFLPGMILLSGSTMIMELLRYREGFHWMNDALHFCLGNTLRKNEMDGKFTGSFYFFAGVTLTAALCDKTSACLGIAQLALADPSASYFGRATRHVYWSRIENGCFGIGRNKGILGFLGGALFCFPFNYRVLSLARCGPAATALPGGRTSVAVASLALGLAGALADLAVPTPAVTLPKRVWGVRVPPLHVDDNFVVPVTSGLACRQLFSKLGWNSQLVQLSRWMIA